MTRVLLVTSCVWLCLGGIASAQITVSMRASATDVRLDDTFQLQVSIESESLQNPDVTLPPLDDFTVLQRQVSRPMSFSFSFGGRQQAVRSTTHYIFVLQPTREGRFTLPAVEAKVGAQVFRSNPLTITVGAGTAPPAAPNAIDPNPAAPGAPPPPSGPIADAAEVDEVAFIRAVADKPTPYVGEQVTVTFYLYLRGNVQVAPSIDTQPTTDGFWIHDLLAPNAQQSGHRQVVRGLSYTAFTLRRFAAFPLREGELTIGPMAVSIDQSSVFDLFAGRAPSSLRRVGQPLVIAAKALPADGKPNGDVAVGRFTVQAKLDRNQAATGDAVTLSATVQGTGNIRTVTLATPVVDGLRVLEPQVRDVVEAPGDLAGGIRTYEWLVVPERAGTFALPPLSLSVFDPQSGQYSVARSDALTLTAAGAAKPSVAADVTPDDDDAAKPTHVEATEDFAPIRTRSALARHATRLIEAKAYWWALLAAPLSWMLLSLSSMIAARRAAARNAPNAERRLRQARQALDAVAQEQSAAKVYAAVSHALSEALGARLDQAIGGYTQSELLRALQERGMDAALAQRVTSLLSVCEQGRFSPLPSGTEQLQQTVSSARECLDAVARFSPRAGESV